MSAIYLLWAFSLPLCTAVAAEAAYPRESSLEAGVAPGEGAQWSLTFADDAEATVGLNAVADVQITGKHVITAGEYLSDVFNLNILVDQRVVAPKSRSSNSSAGVVSSGPRDYKVSGLAPDIRLLGATARRAITALVAPLDLYYQIRGKTVWISSEEQFQADAKIPLPSATVTEGKVFKVVTASRVNIEFEDIHLDDILDFLADGFGLRFVVDRRVVPPENEDNTLSRATPHPYATDGMIQYINFSDTSMAEVLFNLTRLLNLSYEIRADHIFISTPALLAKE